MKYQIPPRNISGYPYSMPGPPGDEIGPGSARLGLDLDAVENPAGNTSLPPTQDNTHAYACHDQQIHTIIKVMHDMNIASLRIFKSPRIPLRYCAFTKPLTITTSHFRAHSIMADAPAPKRRLSRFNKSIFCFDERINNADNTIQITLRFCKWAFKDSSKQIVHKPRWDIPPC